MWRASETTEVAPFELFFDLLYAGTLAINGDHAAENPTKHELLRFSITFIMGWKIWCDLKGIMSWIETDDILQRLSVVLIMVFLLGQGVSSWLDDANAEDSFTTNMLNAFQDTYAILVAFYIAARLFMGSNFLIIARVIPMVRGMMLCLVFLVGISASILLRTFPPV